MFDIGMVEMMLIAIVGLVVLGPQEMKLAVRSVSRLIKKSRALATDISNQLEAEIEVKDKARKK
ncbi:twin-arginine translocase subunit TatB [Vibrio mediterranei]|uniref:Sec-independent protein translocase protein TatB n=1 Tax=Vibrio mediterranei TaxID=689 RepID=UPI00181A7BED|nr:Sec-independent protein translocase protein TatB [Vibrio mediterranei]NUW71733.1 twin-arginine translocase subunit TatB [Vibrio mediterranei]